MTTNTNFELEEISAANAITLDQARVLEANPELSSVLDTLKFAHAQKVITQYEVAIKGKTPHQKAVYTMNNWGLEDKTSAHCVVENPYLIGFLAASDAGFFTKKLPIKRVHDYMGEGNAFSLIIPRETAPALYVVVNDKGLFDSYIEGVNPTELQVQSFENMRRIAQGFVTLSFHRPLKENPVVANKEKALG